MLSRYLFVKLSEKIYFFNEKKVAENINSAIMLNECGEDMKKYVNVKQKHLYTNERNVMFDGYAIYYKEHEEMRLEYKEEDGHTKVSVCAADSSLKIERTSKEMCTSLSFLPNKTTKGFVRSEFGTIDLQVYTHKYIRKDSIIAIEYDILIEGEVSDGYRIIWNVKEDMYS